MSTSTAKGPRQAPTPADAGPSSTGNLEPESLTRELEAPNDFAHLGEIERGPEAWSADDSLGAADSDATVAQFPPEPGEGKRSLAQSVADAPPADDNDSHVSAVTMGRWERLKDEIRYRWDDIGVRRAAIGGGVVLGLMVAVTIWANMANVPPPVEQASNTTMAAPSPRTISHPRRTITPIAHGHRLKHRHR